MSASEIFYLYLFPWVSGIGVMIFLGLVSLFFENVIRSNIRKPISFFGGVIAAGMAYVSLKFAFTHGYDGLPASLRYSLISYGLFGLLAGWGALVELGALLSGDIKERKRFLANSDDAE